MCPDFWKFQKYGRRGKLRNVSGKTDYFLKMAAIFRLVGS
jgi:hypothetical protein